MMQVNALKSVLLGVHSNESDAFINISNGVPVVQYRESVLCPYITIDLNVTDVGTAANADNGERGTIGILEAIKLQGTEKFKLFMEDKNGNKIDLSGENDLRISKTLFAEATANTSSCFVQVVSKEAFDNTLEENRMRDYYLGKGDVIIRSALDSLKTEKDLFADTTELEIEFNGGKRYPFEMCCDVQKVSIPPGIDSAGYLFWETSRGFNFRSLDGMFDTSGKVIKKFCETGFGDTKLPVGFDGKILKSSFVLVNDMLKQFEDGGYNINLDLFNTTSKTRFQVIPRTTPEEGNGIIAGTQMPVVNPDYQNKITDSIFRDNDTGQKVVPGKSLQETITEEKFSINRTSTQAQLNYRQKFSSSLNIVIDADLSLSAGDLVFCNFPQTAKKTSKERSFKSSGIYMIADLCHYSTPTKAFTGLNLVRDSYGVK